MLPLWIIDLGSSAVSQQRLRSLLDSTGESLKPFWHYFHFDETTVTDEAGWKSLMDALVADGRQCYNTFCKAGYKVGNFQIVILGAANEHLSQDVFAPLPGLLRDYLPKIVSDHANLGVEITGVLYIPSTINQQDSLSERTHAAMLLEDVNMLCQRLGSKHYNHVVAYQDVQYKGARFYAALDEEKRTDFLYQILTHLFFVSADSEKFFDKIGQDSGIFSIGAASLYYNSQQHRGRELKRLLDKLIVEYKDKANADNDYAKKIVDETLEENTLNPDTLSERLREECCSLDIDLRKVEKEADPHPVWDFFRSRLFPTYYRSFLKYMPARLLKFLQSLSYLLLARFSAILRKNRVTAISHLKAVLLSLYKKVYLDSAAPFASIAQMESVFSAAKVKLISKRAEVVLSFLEIVPVPHYLRRDYDLCMADEEGNRIPALMDKLKKNLKKEPVVLSLLVRCFLLGILLVFTVIPVLRVVSPNVVNLGEIATIEWLWIPVLFFLPLVINFFIKLRRHFRRIRRLKYRMLAATLLAANKRLSQLLMEEQGAFYDALVGECDVQLQRLDELRNRLCVPEPEEGQNMIPQTLFNQPLLGGSFCGQKPVEDDTIFEAEVPVKDEKLRLSLLEKSDLLHLLKDAFRHPETLQAADLSDDTSPDDHASTLVKQLAVLFDPQLHLHTADNIGLMLSLLGKDFNFAPLQKMAAPNGMLFSVSSGNKLVVRITNAPVSLEGVDVLSDPATADYAFLSSWQKLPQGFQAKLICNCALDTLPPLSLADRLSLYYGFFRQKDLAYFLAGNPLRIPKEEMEHLDKIFLGGDA